jgi:hypothetical protein
VALLSDSQYSQALRPPNHVDEHLRAVSAEIEALPDKIKRAAYPVENSRARIVACSRGAASAVGSVVSQAAYEGSILFARSSFRTLSALALEKKNRPRGLRVTGLSDKSGD